MNQKIKDLNLAAMFLALYAVFLIINRNFFADFFGILNIILAAIIQIIYIYKTKNDYSLLLGFSMIFICFIFSDLINIFALPFSMLIARLFHLAKFKKMATANLFIYILVITFIYELFSIFIIMPLFGFPFDKEIVEAAKIINSYNFNQELTALIKPIYLVIALMFINALFEAIIIRNFSLIIFRYLKIHDYPKSYLLTKWECYLAYIIFINAIIFIIINAKIELSNALGIAYQIISYALCLILIRNGYYLLQMISLMKGRKYFNPAIIYLLTFLMPFIVLPILFFCGFIYSANSLHLKNYRYK